MMRTKRFVIALVAVLCAAAGPAFSELPVLRPDRALQQRLAEAFGRAQGAAILYDMQARRVVAVTDADAAFGALHPPGSLMKLVSAVAFLRGRIELGTVKCTNHVQIAGRDFTCAVEGGHGTVDLRRAIAKSCSIFFYVTGQRITPAQLASAARSLGLGQPSPFPAGATAQLATPPTQRDRTLMLVGEAGVRITPWDAVVLATRLHDGRDEATRFVYASMRDVVTSGTGADASVPGVDVRGKTGTASLPDGKRHGWFVCTAGRMALVVFLQDGTGHDAAALAGRILKSCGSRLK